MKKNLRALFLLPVLGLAGCCANNVCNCNDLYADALYFQFDTTSAQGFAAADVDTVYLVQYSPTNATVALNTLTLIRAQVKDSATARQLRQYRLDPTTIILNNASPFTPATTGGKLSQYTYSLLVPKGDSLTTRTAAARPVYSFRIGPITLNGQYDADGCCTCYQNTKKTVSVNGTFYDVTETDKSAGTTGTPRPVVLHRP